MASKLVDQPVHIGQMKLNIEGKALGKWRNGSDWRMGWPGNGIKTVMAYSPCFTRGGVEACRRTRGCPSAEHQWASVLSQRTTGVRLQLHQQLKCLQRQGARATAGARETPGGRDPSLTQGRRFPAQAIGSTAGRWKGL